MKTPSRGFLQSINLKRGRVSSFKDYPFCIPSVEKLHKLKLHPKVTFFIGENGSGKSTLMEAIAVGMGFNAEGGSWNFNFSTRASHSKLFDFLEFDRGSNLRKPKTGFFLRAESYFNVATELEKLQEGTRGGLFNYYGGVTPHEQSHGESFFALMANRFGPDGIYILDEPEAALSPRRQLSCLTLVHQLVRNGSQFIIATHSPILMAYPDAVIYEFSETGIKSRKYEETEHYVVTRDFLNRREKMLKILLEEGDEQNDAIGDS
jgi:predicted ATPase